MFIEGGSAPRSNPFTLLYTIFHEKGTPFVYLLLTNGTPSTVPCLELHPFDCCNCTVFQIGINHKKRRFLDFIKP